MLQAIVVLGTVMDVLLREADVCCLGDMKTINLISRLRMRMR